MSPRPPHDTEYKITFLFFRIMWLTSPTRSRLRPPSSTRMNLPVSGPAGARPWGPSDRPSPGEGLPRPDRFSPLLQVLSRHGLCSTARSSRWTSGRGIAWKATGLWCCLPPQVTAHPRPSCGPCALAPRNKANTSEDSTTSCEE